MENRRLTAIKTKINPILSGRYISQSGFTPNYVLTPDGMKLSRVRILATIVDKYTAESGKFASITLDDFSSTIRAKAFNNISIFDGYEIGDIVDVIGKIREYNGEIYLHIENIIKIDDPNWEILRDLEIKKQLNELKQKREKILYYQKQTADLDELKKLLKEREGISEDEVEAILESQELVVVEDVEPNKEAKNKILKLIEGLDRGEGCEYQELIQESGIQEDVLDSIINELLEDGLCFEPRPGRIKKL
jgi:RPA family protein